MGTYKRKIKFCYYKVFQQFLNENGTQSEFVPFNLVDWLAIAANLKNNYVGLSDCTVTLDNISYHNRSNSEIYVARFLKIRDVNVPSIVKEGEVSQPIPLEDDEYIGEDVLLLYDRTNNICMFQQNRHSLSVKKLSEWVNMERDKNKPVVFLSLKNPFSPNNLKRKYIRSIDFTLANLDVDTNSHGLMEIINGAREFEGCTAKISISVGHMPKTGLNNNKVTGLLQDLISNPGSVSSAHIKVQNLSEDDTPEQIQLVDLLENSYHDYVEFDIEYKKPLEFETGQIQLLSFYLERIEDLKRHIGV